MNEIVGPATDQHALAVLLFEMLTGELPFEGKTLGHMVDLVVRHVPPPVSDVAKQAVPAAIDGAVARALAKDATDRFATVRDFMNALGWVDGARGRAFLPPFSEHETLRPAASPPKPVEQRRGEASELMALAEKARHAFERRDLRSAAWLAANVVDRASQSADPSVSSIATLTSGTFDDILLARLGGLEARLTARRAPSGGEALTPRRAYLLSRLDGLRVIDTFDVSGVGRSETLASLVLLADHGLIASSGAPSNP
jgi:hypothetical protein